MTDSLTDSFSAQDQQDELSAIAQQSTVQHSPLMTSASFKSDYQKQFKSNSLNSDISDAMSKNINHYVRGIMQDLVGNLQYVNSTTPIAVTSFVFLEGDFEQSGLLGNQIAESFIHEVHKFGIPVIDFKTTDFIRVTEQGDFILSRDFIELTPGLPVKYVVLGTLAPSKGGLIVNARIVGIKSKAVVATAQSFIPEHVAQPLMKQSQSGISLVQGS